MKWISGLQTVLVLLAGAFFLYPPSVIPMEAPMRIGLAAVFLDEPRVLLDEWAGYLSRELGRPVEFVQRRTYAELSEELHNGTLQASWVCTYPYLAHRDQFRLLAIPVFKGRPTYQSYFIVPEEDRETRDITDLEGKVFAYADSRSFSGYVIPRHWLRQAGVEPDHFFRTTFFTWSHRDSIVAVAEGLADGAAVDSYIWESMRRVAPGITERTRVVRRSQAFGFPPMVTGSGMDEVGRLRLQQALIGMNGDPAGRSLLKRLFLDRFEIPREGLYRSAMDVLGEFSG